MDLGKARAARALLWIGGEGGGSGSEGSAGSALLHRPPLPIPPRVRSSGETRLICWDTSGVVTCHRPGAQLQQRLVSEHLVLKWNIFQLSGGFARSAKILLLCAGCGTCHFLPLYLDRKHLEATALFTQAHLER